MSKKFNLGSGSDMRRLQRQLSDLAASAVKEQLQDEHYDIECPHCNAQISVHAGKNTCPKCGDTINFNLEFTF